MSHTPNELAELFPQDHALLHQLKLEPAHFAQLADRYHDLNREIHRIESDIEPASDEHLEALKKDRLHLSDQIAALLAEARGA